MRLMLTIENAKEISIPYREYIRNFIYKSIENSNWHFYHDKPRYKHYCFSNIFPFNASGLIGSNFKFLISSPYIEFIKIIDQNILKNPYIDLGKERFKIISVRQIHTPKIIDKVQTATPIILRMGKNSIQKYGTEKNKEYAFWNEKEILNAFIDLLIKNASLRYSDFIYESKMFGLKEKYQELGDKINFFSALKYKKTVYGWDKHFTGTMWEFHVNMNYQDHDFTKFLYESGLGERNSSSGGGFLNIIQTN